MALGTPYFLGSASAGTASTSTYITTTTTVSANDCVVVCADSNYIGFTTNVTSVTDTVGNTYTHVISTSSSNPYCEVWVALKCTALPASGVITVTWSTSSNDINACALGCSGVATASAVDKSLTTQTTSATTLTLTTGTLGLASELAVGFWSTENAIGPAAPTTGWTVLTTFVGLDASHYDTLAAQVTTSVNAFSAVATVQTAPGGNRWSAVLVTLRSALIPTATAACGGSSTAYNVQTVTGTAFAPVGGTSNAIQGASPATYPAPWNPPFPIVFAAGYTPLPADFTQWVQQSLAYCTDKIIFRAEASTTQPLTAATWAALVFGNILEDPFKGWSATSTSTQAANSWLAPWTGWYRITFRFTITGATGWLDAGLGVTGVNPTYEAGSTPVVSSFPGGSGASVLTALIGGTDYIQALARMSVNATVGAANEGLDAYVEISPAQTDLQG